MDDNKELKNLKVALLDMQTRLVHERGWKAGDQPLELPKPAIKPAKTTQPIIDFLHFLHENPEAAQLLPRYGLEWPLQAPTGFHETGATLNIQEDDDPLAGISLGTPQACSLGSTDCESCQ